MARLPEYDKDRYKPSHERTDPATNLGKMATKDFIKELNKFRKDTNRKISRQEGKSSIKTPIFVPLDPTEPINGVEDRTENKLVNVSIGFVGIYLFLMLVGTRALSGFLGLSFWYVIPIEIVLGFLIYLVIINKFVFKVNDQAIKEARNRGNKSINLGNVWGINPGGIKEKVELGRLNTRVFYKGKEAVVLKILKKSVLTSEENADWLHYNALEQVETILSNSGYAFTKINMMYNTENDYIWDELDENLVTSSILYGKEYSDIMSEIFTYQRRQTKALSRVSVLYYVIKPDLVKTVVPIDKISLDIATTLRYARCSLGTVTNKEFLKLLKEYYGVNYLNISEITDHISALTDTPVEVSLVRYINNAGELVKLKEEYEANISESYKYRARYESEAPFKVRNKVIDIEEFSIFGDKSIEQEAN